MKSAVLVIDVQQGLCQGPGAAYDCDGTIRRTNAVTRKARYAGMPVIFIQQQVIAHHNLTLSNIKRFGLRVTALPSASVTF